MWPCSAAGSVPARDPGKRMGLSRSRSGKNAGDVSRSEMRGAWRDRAAPLRRRGGARHERAASRHGWPAGERQRRRRGRASRRGVLWFCARFPRVPGRRDPPNPVAPRRGRKGAPDAGFAKGRSPLAAWGSRGPAQRPPDGRIASHHVTLFLGRFGRFLLRNVIFDVPENPNVRLRERPEKPSNPITLDFENRGPRGSSNGANAMARDAAFEGRRLRRQEGRRERERPGRQKERAVAGATAR